MFGFCSLLQPQQCVLCASCHPVVVPVASERPKLMQIPTPPQRGARLPPASLFLRFFLLDNIDMSGAHKWLHVLPLDTPGPSVWSWCVARLGLPLSFWLRMIPHSQGKQELQPPAPRKCSSSHGSVGKAHSHLLLQHCPFPCSSSLSMSVNTTQSSLLGCCGCSVSGRGVWGGTTALFWGGCGTLCLSFPVDDHSQYLVLAGDQSSLDLHPSDLKSTRGWIG